MSFPRSLSINIAEETNPFLFHKMTQARSEEIFKENPGKTWLMRESNIEGMLSVDLVNSHYDENAQPQNADRQLKHLRYLTYRIAALPHGDWRIVNSIAAAKGILDSIIPITAKNFNAHQSDFERFITGCILKNHGYYSWNRISPAVYSPSLRLDRMYKPDVDESCIDTQPLADDFESIPTPASRTAKRARTENTEVLNRANTLVGIRSHSGNGPRPAFFPATTKQLVSLPATSSSIDQAKEVENPQRKHSKKN